MLWKIPNYEDGTMDLLLRTRLILGILTVSYRNCAMIVVSIQLLFPTSKVLQDSATTHYRSHSVSKEPHHFW